MRFLVVVVALALMVLTAPPASADGRVYVDPAIPGAPREAARIEGQLRPDDSIAVKILTNQSRNVPPLDAELIFVAVDGTTMALADGWMGQTVADDILQRAQNVAVNPVDQAVMFIRTAHKWYDTHPRPIPPAPPQPPDYTLLGAAVGFTVTLLLIALITWRVRVKRRIAAGLAQRAEDPEYWKGVMEDLNKRVGE